ncbi:hypothetical protein FWG95_04620 [Candidatus Saccharibacteria bacterium]|nr:hypothetical protein [Candidatus Saccharibacteria bacterium]
MTETVFQRIYSGKIPESPIYRGEEDVSGATLMLDKFQHNKHVPYAPLGRMVVFLGAEAFSDIERTADLPSPQQATLHQLAYFARDLAVARGVATDAFVTCTEKEVRQAHLVVRPIDPTADSYQEQLATLLLPPPAFEELDGTETDNLRDRLSLSEEQRAELTQHLAQITLGETPNTSIAKIARMR